MDGEGASHLTGVDIPGLVVLDTVRNQAKQAKMGITISNTLHDL